MKIQNVGFFTNKKLNINNKINKNKIGCMQQLRNDTISFSGNAVDWDILMPIKKSADATKQESNEFLKKAYEYIPLAYETLNETKQSFIQSIDYINIVNKSLKKNQPISELDGSLTLNYVTVMKNGKPVPFLINIYDSFDERQIKSISVNNGVPTQIIDFNEDGTTRIAQFSSDSIIISDGISMDGQNIESGYVFNGGKLVSVRKNQKLTRYPYYVDESYFFKDGKLWICEQGTKMYRDGSRKIDNRYNFLSDKLLNYYSKFESSSDGLYKWDESYHYNKNGEFIGTTANAGKKSLNNNLLAKTAVYSHFNKFISANNVQCFINDNAPVRFLES